MKYGQSYEYAVKYRNIDSNDEYLYLCSFDNENKAKFYIKEMKRRKPALDYQIFKLDTKGDYSIIVRGEL